MGEEGKRMCGQAGDKKKKKEEKRKVGEEERSGEKKN